MVTGGSMQEIVSGERYCSVCAPFVEGGPYADGTAPQPPFHPNCDCEVVAVVTEAKNTQAKNLFRAMPVRGIGGVDRDGRVIYGVSCAQAVEALGHGMQLDDVTLAQIVAAGNGQRSGLKSRYTHPGLSSDGMGKFLGRLRSFRVVDDKALADLHLSDAAFASPDGNLGQYVLDLAEEDPEAFGTSIVFELGSLVWVLEDGQEVRANGERPENAINELPAVRIKKLFACDVVDEPAANRDGMFSSALWGTNVLAADTFTYIDREIGRMGVTPERALEFALSYFDARGLSVHKGVAVSDVEVTKESGVAVLASPVAEDVWAVSLRRQGIDAILLASGLPLKAREAVRLGLPERAIPEDVDRAIVAQRDALAEAVGATVVQGHKPVMAGDMVTAGEELQGAVNWMFGASAVLPRPHLRSVSDIYQVLTGDTEWYGVFQPDRVSFASATTATFPGMAVNALNIVVQMHYESQVTYRWFENIVEVMPHDGSTHDVQMIMVDGIGLLPTVSEGAAYTEAVVGDSKESMAFSKRGVYVGITMEMIRRSEIARIRAVPKGLVQASVRTRSGRIANIFTQASGVGPTLADDSTALFHSNHGNVLTTAFGDTAWAAARASIFNQTIPGSSSKLGLWPRFVLVPVGLYDTALILYGYGSGDVGKSGGANLGQNVNPYAESRVGDPRPIPVPVPEFSDANDWAYITDPREHGPIKMAYANGPGGNVHPAPEVFQVQSESAGLMFSNDVLPVKIRDWFGFGVSTHVGVGKNNVA